jgi:hypothetical protein
MKKYIFNGRKSMKTCAKSQEHEGTVKEKNAARGPRKLHIKHHHQLVIDNYGTRLIYCKITTTLFTNYNSTLRHCSTSNYTVGTNSSQYSFIYCFLSIKYRKQT